VAIRFRDQSSFLGNLASTLEDSTAAFAGTFTPLAERTGTIASNVQNATALFTGIFSAAPNRTGTIASTLQSATSSITGALLTGSNVFPLTVSGRRLLDKNGQPFLINGDTPWSLIVQLTDAETTQYITDRKNRGFNTVLFNSIEAFYADNAPFTVAGLAPFNTPNDIRTPNDAYFNRLSSIVGQFKAQEMLCMATPAYLGLNTNEGWRTQLLARTVGECTTYGSYLGAKFAAHPNIMWVMGGDFFDSTLLSRTQAIVNGLKATGRADWLFTYHAAPGNSSADVVNSESWLNVVATYNQDTALVVSDLELDYGRATVRPFMFFEGRYEQEGFPAIGRIPLRSQAFWAPLTGGVGAILGNSPIWHFEASTYNFFSFSGTWQSNLAGNGSVDRTQFGTFFNSFAWQNLVPDRNSSVLTGGAGSGADRAYAARASDGSKIVAYTPSQKQLTIAMGQISGTDASCTWRHPQTGAITAIGTFPASGSRQFTPPTSSDYLLIIDAVSSATDVTTFAVGGSGSDVLTFGHTFAVGEVPSTQEIVVTTTADATVASQCDRKAFHSDGSLRHAVITAQVTGGTSYKLRRRTVVAQSALTKAALISALGTTTVTFSSGITATINVGSLLGTAPEVKWLEGAQCVEYHVDAAASANIHVFAHCRLYATGRVKVFFVIENTWAYVSPRQNVSYTYTIVLNGVQQVSSSITHRAGTRIPHEFWNTTPAIFPQHNLTYLKGTKAIPNYSHPQAVGSVSSVYGSLPTTYTIQSNGPFGALMEQGGLELGIGPLPHHQAVWCMANTDVRTWQAVTIASRGGTGYSTHFRNNNSGDTSFKRVVSIVDRPQAGYERGDFVSGGTNPSGGSPYSADAAHCPSIAYLPYLVTGDYFWLEELQFWASWNWFTNAPTDTMSPNARQQATGLFESLQLRGQAWALREISRTAYITPDADVLKSYFVSRLANNETRYTARYVDGSIGTSKNIFGALDAGQPDLEGRNNTKTWMDDFFTWAVFDTVKLGFTGWQSVATYKAAFPLGRIGGSPAGYCHHYAGPDTVSLAPSATGTFHASWAIVYSNTAPSGVSSAACGSQAQVAAMNASAEGSGHPYTRGEIRGYPDLPGSRFGTMHIAAAQLVDAGVVGADIVWARLRAAAIAPNTVTPKPNWLDTNNGGAANALWPLYSETTVPAYIRNLAAGAALQISNTNLTNTIPAYSGSVGYPTQVVYAWSGGAYDTRRGELLVTGGGHSDGNNNGIYGFRPYESETPGWRVVLAPDAARNPPATHTYNVLAYDHENDYFMQMGLGSVYPSGSSNGRIWGFNRTTGAYDSEATHPSISEAQGASCCYDPVEKVIWRKAGSGTGLLRYNVATKAVTTISDGLSGMNIEHAMAIDPYRRFLLVMGGYSGFGPLSNQSARMLVIDLTTNTGFAMNPANLPTALSNRDSLGLEFHPPSGSFVAHGGSTALWRIIPPADPTSATGWTFTQLTPTGTTLPAESARGTYGRWRWAPYPNDPSKGVFLVFQASSTDPFPLTNVYIYKPNF
jgi:hypothetical protein